MAPEKNGGLSLLGEVRISAPGSGGPVPGIVNYCRIRRTTIPADTCGGTGFHPRCFSLAITTDRPMPVGNQSMNALYRDPRLSPRNLKLFPGLRSKSSEYSVFLTYQFRK